MNPFWLQELGSLQEYLLALNTEDHLHRCTAQVQILHNPRDVWFCDIFLVDGDNEQFLIAQCYKIDVLGLYNAVTGLCNL